MHGVENVPAYPFLRQCSSYTVETRRIIHIKICRWSPMQTVCTTGAILAGGSPIKGWTVHGRRRGERGGEGRAACNINPFNKLIIDEIYRAFTVRGGGANALHLSRGNPGYISGLAPLRLDLRARANEPRPASAYEEEVHSAERDDAAALGH